MKVVVLAILIVVTFGANVARGEEANQDDAPEIKNLVSQLSWESVEVACVGLILQIFPKGDAAERLVKIGKPATEELLAALGDEDKALAAHVILSAIWEPSRMNLVASESIYKRRLLGKKYVGTRYSFKGLTWVERLKGVSIDKVNLTENAARWRAKVAGNGASATRRRA